MTNETVKLILDSIHKDYHDFLEKATTLASNSLINKNVNYRFYEKNADGIVDFENPKIKFGKVTGVTVTSDNDILFDLTDSFTEEKFVMFSCDILSVEG